MKTLLKTYKLTEGPWWPLPFHNQKQTTLKQSCLVNKGTLIWFLPTPHGEGWIHWPSISTWTSLKSAKSRNPEISAHHPHGQSRWVPSYSGSLRVSGINLPTWGNGGMVAVAWQRQCWLYDHANSWSSNSGHGMSDTRQSVIKTTKQTWKTGLTYEHGRGGWDTGAI